MQLNGFIKIHRKLVKWGWYTDNVVKGVFLHLLLMANYEPSEWQGRTLMPGQLVTGRKRLAQDLDFTEQQVRTALLKLKSTNEITIEATNKYSIITIVNWDEYQFNDYMSNQEYNQLFNQQITNEQPTNNQQITTYKEIKNKRNKEYINTLTHTHAHAREFLALNRNILSEISKKVSCLSFNCWFSEFALVEKNENTYIFCVPNIIRKSTIEREFSDVLKDVLLSITGEASEIEIITQEDE